jgi:16S rRNA (guanine527-N7)-methyltransferase
VKHHPPGGVEGLGAAQLDLLHAYQRLLTDKGIPMGVVSRGDRDRLWDRHVADSLRAVACIPTQATLADLGSGGGLPGIPIAIARPDTMVTLVEARQRRVAFLELAIETLELPNVHVIASRVEEAALRVDGCTARALAPAEEAWTLASPLLLEGGFLIYWAGRSWGRRQMESLAGVGLEAEVCSRPSTVWQGSVVKMARTVLDPEQGVK